MQVRTDLSDVDLDKADETVAIYSEKQKQKCAADLYAAFEEINDYKIEYDASRQYPWEELESLQRQLSSQRNLANKLASLGRQVMADIGTPKLSVEKAEKIAESAKIMAVTLASDAGWDVKGQAINKFSDAAAPMNLGRAALNASIGAVIGAAVGFILAVLTLGVASAFLGLIAGAAVGAYYGFQFFEKRNRREHPESLDVISAARDFRSIVAAR